MKLFIVDKQALFREGLIWLLENHTDIDVVGQASSGQDGVEKVGVLQPDVMLLDNNLPDGPGFKFIPSIHIQCPNTKIVVLAQTDKDEYLTAAIRCGVNGYLSKDISFPALVSSLKTLEHSLSIGFEEAQIDPFEEMVDEQATDPWLAPSDPTPLTPREFKIFQYLGNGTTNQEIADLLGISVGTVKSSVHHIYRKLGLKNRREAKQFIFLQGSMVKNTG